MSKNVNKIISLFLSLYIAAGGILPIFAQNTEISENNGEVTTDFEETSTSPLAEPAYIYRIEGLGNVTGASVKTLGAASTYYNYTTDENGVKQSAHILVGDASRGALVIGAELGTGFGKRGRVSALTDDAEGENRLIGAVNADFFSLATGVPMGVFVADGRYISSSDGGYGVGFREDGSAVFGKIGDTTSVVCGDETLEVHYFNKFPTVYGAYLLTRDFGESTRLESGIAATEYIIAFEGDIVLGESVFGEIISVRTSAAAAEIPEGCAVLVVPDIYDYSALYRTLEVGDRVEIKTSVNEEFYGILSAIGGGDVILRGGEVTDTLTDDAIETARNPRTAFGVTADGEYMLCVVDGRKSGYSIGVKLTALAEAMRDLGCVDAINLDGGGSSVMVLFGGGATVVNRPSDGAERTVPNALALYENREVTSILHTLDFTADETLLYSGVKIPLNLALKNAFGEAVDIEFTEENTFFTVDELFGSVAFEEGIPTFTAGSSCGVGKITVNVILDSETVTADLFLEVATEVDSLAFDQNIILSDADVVQTLTLNALLGEKEVFFGDKVSVLCDSEDIACSIDGRNVTLSLENAEKGQGSVTAVLGEKLVSVPVYFDSELALNIGELIAPFVTVSNEGYTVTYDTAGGVMGEGAFVVASPVPVEVREETTAETVENTEISEIAETTEPVETAEPTETSEPAETTEPEPELMPVFESFEIKIDADGALVTSGLSGRRIWVWADGLAPESLPYAVIKTESGEEIIYYERFYDFLDYSGRALFTLSLDGFEGVVTLKTLFAYTAYADTQNVILGAPIITETLDTNLYADTAEHWSGYYVNALSYMGIVNGSENLYGELVYTPDGGLSREQFAKILVNYLKIDVEQYAETPLDFADIDSIAPWALPYVRAAVGTGLMKGRSTPADTIIFAPTDGIKRQEAIYVLGGLLGETEAAELSFTDSDSVAPWARENLSKALAAGIVSGYDDGTLRPEGGITRAEAATVVVRLYEFSSES